MAFLDRIRALLGVSTYALPPSTDPGLDDASIEEIRKVYGGQLSPMQQTRTRWYLADLETAEHLADQGDLSMAAQLMRAVDSDGVESGLMSTRTGGLVRLPKVFRGDEEMVNSLKAGGDVAASVFDEMFPATELAKLAADGVKLGVGVGEMLQVEGRDFPVFVRLSPEFLRYRWSENRWYYQSIAGLIPITPGDGRWILHLPGGRNNPWQNGSWRAIGKAFIRKEHANLHKDNWEGKLANPARVAFAPAGGTDEQAQSWFRKVMAWGINTVFGLKPGYDVKLLESNGRGADSFRETIKEQNNEFMIAICGQTVTTDGGTGFANADIHKSIRADLIKETADALAYTINTQGIPAWVMMTYGEDALERRPTVEWDVTPPKDRNSEATAMGAVGTAIKQLTEALQAHGLKPDAKMIAERFNIPVKQAEQILASEPANSAPADREEIAA